MRFKYSDTDTVSDIRTRIRTDLNPSKRIRFRIRSENIRTVFIPTCYATLAFLVDFGKEVAAMWKNGGSKGEWKIGNA